MAEFLSDGWFDEMTAAAERARPPRGVRIVLQQVITPGGDGGEAEDGDGDEERSYALRVAGGQVELVRGRFPGADVTFTQDRATAAAIARGELSAQLAFLGGRLRVGGDLRHFAEAAGALAELDDVFAPVREVTRW